MIAIQGAYTKITTALAVPNLYNIDPFDLYGNLLSEMTIEVDSTLAQPAIFLPAIADLNNNWQIKINIIATTGSVFPVFIGVANPPDKIGAAYDVSLISDGSSIEINPIGDNNWYGVISDKSLTTPAYKVYTALLTQSGGDVPQGINGDEAIPLTIGVTYEIVDNTGLDVTNVGSPNNNIGTKFVATGTTPNSWGNIDGWAILGYNTGAPVVTVLENTIGNIWFTYDSIGVYLIKSSALFSILTYVDGKGFVNGADENIKYSICTSDENTNVITTTNNVTLDDSLLYNTPIEIRVYN